MRWNAEAGLSLIEVLVSMVLALLTFLIMFQMFESWDRSKRTTASGGGAMITGALALFRLERDLRLAGFGFGNASELGCSVAAFDSRRVAEDAAALAARAAGPEVSTTVSNEFSFPLVPVQIVNATGALDANGKPVWSDKIVVLYGSSEGVSTTRLFGTAAAGSQPYTALPTAFSTQMEIGALGGMQQGDLVVLADGTNCDMVEVTDASNNDRRTFEHKKTGDLTGGVYANSYTDGGTPAAVPVYNNTAGTAVGGIGRAYVLGPRAQRRIWQIRNDNRRTLAFINDLGSGTGVTSAADAHKEFTDIADNVINLQAQYGFAGVETGATPPCAAVSPPQWGETAPTDNCKWGFVYAIRVGLLARSDQFEKTTVTANRPSWAGGDFEMTNVDGTTDSNPVDASGKGTPNNWRNYRYRVFESIVPLKNIMWGTR